MAFGEASSDLAPVRTTSAESSGSASSSSAGRDRRLSGSSVLGQHGAPLTIPLSEKGGRAGCQLAVRGKHVRTATAFGRFGRTTCRAELPSPEPSDASATGQQGS